MRFAGFAQQVLQFIFVDAVAHFKTGNCKVASLDLQLRLANLVLASKFRYIRSPSTEMQSINENDFECLASTGVNTLATAHIVAFDLNWAWEVLPDIAPYKRLSELAATWFGGQAAIP